MFKRSEERLAQSDLNLDDFLSGGGQSGQIKNVMAMVEQLTQSSIIGKLTLAYNAYVSLLSLMSFGFAVRIQCFFVRLHDLRRGVRTGRRCAQKLV
jgi:hypothetical protein